MAKFSVRISIRLINIIILLDEHLLLILFDFLQEISLMPDILEIICWICTPFLIQVVISSIGIVEIIIQLRYLQYVWVVHIVIILRNDILKVPIIFFIVIGGLVNCWLFTLLTGVYLSI